MAHFWTFLIIFDPYKLIIFKNIFYTITSSKFLIANFVFLIIDFYPPGQENINFNKKVTGKLFATQFILKHLLTKPFYKFITIPFLKI
jgi:hypothetical protein